MTKEELKQEFEKYLKDSIDYYDPREPLTERKLLQMWLDCAEPREKRIADLEKQIKDMESGVCTVCAEVNKTIKLNKAVEIIGKLCGTVRTLNNPNTQLADVDDFLAEAEKFVKECELCM